MNQKREIAMTFHFSRGSKKYPRLCKSYAEKNGVQAFRAFIELFESN